MYKIYFLTFGCKVNQYETDSLKSQFTKMGFAVTDSPAEADAAVVNSCTVTSGGDSKSLYAVRKLRRDCPDAVIVLTGCLPQAAGKPDIPEADIITGTKDRHLLPGMVLDALQNGGKTVSIPEYSPSDAFETMEYTAELHRTRAYIKIQDGCNCFCSYCIIPYARGRCRSKPLEDIRREAQMLADAGHRELVLVGINLAFYGKEFGLRLADAVEVCCNVPGIDRVRLSSLEPEMLLDGDLERLAALPELCPQFHLSLQSGCAKTLKAMNRRYTPDEYFALTERIRQLIPDAAFTTDIMVGFPGETEEDHWESMEFAEKVGFSKIHVFQYSPRKGTPAAKMPQVPGNIKQRRGDEMKSLAASLQERYLKSLVGRSFPVLFERENSPLFHQGCTPDHTLVKISRKNSEKSLRNEIKRVIIEMSYPDYCFGSLSEDQDC
ncbi:MAG: tRNA (N(6)-L-threonylcarbamoyladenosine(37)-C(2))-methylthiotransferase MtaB [Ruminococcus sp.]|nr:tRNA (N(6)-L-threonylcarbamoyladenosine(37)-C(2))-methylthiotransferase MtaB [Ruminococcus sp.]